MKVWTVLDCEPYEGCYVEKVFVSKELAEEYLAMKDLFKDGEYYTNKYAGQWTLDGVPVGSSKVWDDADDDFDWGDRLQFVSEDYYMIRAEEVIGS